MKNTAIALSLAFMATYSGITSAQVTPEAKAMIAAETEKATHISAAELKKALDAKEKVVILDIRQTSERPKAGLITADDVHIPRGYLEIKGFGMLPDKDANIVVYCGKGIRSVFAVNTLKEMGYSNVRNLKGGAFAWKKQGYNTLPVNNISPSAIQR